MTTGNNACSTPRQPQQAGSDDAGALGVNPPGDWETVVDTTRHYLGAVEHVEAGHTLAVPARELVDLYRKLESQPVIEQAKGILMGYYGLGPDAAFAVLRRWSQNGNLKLRSLAELLVSAVTKRSTSNASPEALLRDVLAERGGAALSAVGHGNCSIDDRLTAPADPSLTGTTGGEPDAGSPGRRRTTP